MPQRIIIMGATSGLGEALAKRFIAEGWIVGVAGRNKQALEMLKALAPNRVFVSVIDILEEGATGFLQNLIDTCGGMDIYLHCSGIALLNDEYSIENEVRIAETNAVGFTQMVCTAYRYFSDSQHPGRLVAISSVAGIRGLEILPAYSASKSYDSTLLEALRQRAHGAKLPLRIVDIRPGWTRTPLLDSSKHYMWEMDAGKASELIFHAVLKARRSATIGLRWRMLTAIERLVPGWLWEKLHIQIILD